MENKRSWAALINVRAEDGYEFVDLIDLEGEQVTDKYIGAWVNVIVKADTFIEAYYLVLKGVSEKQFFVFDIDYLRDYQYFKENHELDSSYEEADTFLNNSEFRFVIVGRMHPYTDLEE